MSERLPCVDVAQVHLVERDGHAKQGIPERDRRVREPARVDHDRGDPFVVRGVNPVEQHVLGVALEVSKLAATIRREGRELGDDVVEGAGAIVVRFPEAEQVQVRPVE